MTAPTIRTDTPDRRSPDGHKVITVKRYCSGCSKFLGDATVEEIQAVVEGRPLPDTRQECGCSNVIVGVAWGQSR